MSDRNAARAAQTAARIWLLPRLQRRVLSLAVTGVNPVSIAALTNQDPDTVIGQITDLVDELGLSGWDDPILDTWLVRATLQSQPSQPGPEPDDPFQSGPMPR